MATIQYEVLEAFRAAGVPEEQAARAAQALASGATGEGDRLGRIESRITVIESRITVIESRISVIESRTDVIESHLGKLDEKVSGVGLEITAIRLDMTAIRGEQSLVRWMLATVLAGVLAIVLKLFIH